MSKHRKIVGPHLAVFSNTANPITKNAMTFPARNTIHPGWLAAITAGVLLTSSGCGAKLPVISGTVTLDGQPLPNATVLFMPQDTTRSPAQSVTDAEGQYTLQQEAGAAGVQPGEYSVRISTYQPGSRDVAPRIPAIREKIPLRYNLETELHATISADQPASEASFDFTLQSGGAVFQPEPDPF